MAKHYKHLVETYFREGHNFWNKSEPAGPRGYTFTHECWIRDVGAKLKPRNPTYGQRNSPDSRAAGLVGSERVPPPKGLGGDGE